MTFHVDDDALLHQELYILLTEKPQMFGLSQSGLLDSCLRRSQLLVINLSFFNE